MWSLRRVLCCVGFIICAYLLWTKTYYGICFGHCETLNYALGMVWFFSGVVLSEKFLKLWSLTGVLGITYFVVREFFEGFCAYCSLLHVIGLLAILTSTHPVRLGLSFKRLSY